MSRVILLQKDMSRASLLLHFPSRSILLSAIVVDALGNRITSVKRVTGSTSRECESPV